MPKKKVEEVEETVETAVETEVSEEVAVEAKAEYAALEEVAADAAPEAPARKAAPKKEKAAKAEPAAKKPAKAKKEAEGSDAADGSAVHKGKRAEKIGVVASDLMTKTVTVRVDRLVKHPVYRKYVRKRKKFMAHDELGAKIGDKVRIIETRPLSARKRWRVVEIIQKAER